MVSIFIPVYNGEQFLSSSLDSVLKQTYNEWEILCVDDSSTDSSFTILQNYAKRDSRIRVFQKQNGGCVPPSWQYVFPLLTGNFTIYMSQDDFIEPSFLEKMTQRQKETNSDVVFPDEIHYHPAVSNGILQSLCGIDGDITQIINGTDAFRLMIDYEISGRGLWKTSLIKETGISTETYNADELAQREWVSRCKTVAFCDARFYYRRNNINGITTHFSPLIFEDTLTNARLLELINKLLPNDIGLIQSHANRYFAELMERHCQFFRYHSHLNIEQKKKIKSCFRKAWEVEHTQVLPTDRKLQLGSKSYFIFLLASLYKTIKHQTWI